MQARDCYDSWVHLSTRAPTCHWIYEEVSALARVPSVSRSQEPGWLLDQVYKTSLQWHSSLDFKFMVRGCPSNSLRSFTNTNYSTLCPNVDLVKLKISFSFGIDGVLSQKWARSLGGECMNSILWSHWSFPTFLRPQFIIGQVQLSVSTGIRPIAQ